MSSVHWKKKVYQVVWEDARAWVEQLWGTHGALVTVEMRLMPTKTQVSSAVVVTVERMATNGVPGRQERVWQVFSPRDPGSAEAAAVQLLSSVLLRWDDEAALAAEQSALL